MAIVLRNAILLHLDPPDAGPGELRVDNGRITDIGAPANVEPGDEVLDCRGCVVMPGLVNGHTHLYSALAVGMPAPSQAPANFYEILQFIWWRMDRALDDASVRMSGTIGALEALRCGTTALIDHHASPNCISGSLDLIEAGIDAVGLRAVLCYETTDRNGPVGATAGLEENRRYLEKCAARKDHRFAAMVGAHAAFTLSDDSLQACAELAKKFGVGVHIHVAEDPCDDRICREQYGASLVERLDRCGVLQPDTVVAHGVHLSPEAARGVSARVAAVAHNPRSNMNNQVGYAPLESFANVQLGTDGIGSDMFSEARHAWFKARDANSSLLPTDMVNMLAQSARTAGRRLGCTLGKLEPGAAADIVVTDYVPATPLRSANVAGHLVFGIGPQHVRNVLVAGRWMLRDRVCQTIQEDVVRQEARSLAGALWQRMQQS